MLKRGSSGDRGVLFPQSSYPSSPGVAQGNVPTQFPAEEEAMVLKTYQRILVHAYIVASDETVLAERLGFPVKAVMDWFSGDAPVSPDGVSALGGYRVGRALLDQIKRRHRR